MKYYNSTKYLSHHFETCVPIVTLISDVFEVNKLPASCTLLFSVFNLLCTDDAKYKNVHTNCEDNNKCYLLKKLTLKFSRVWLKNVTCLHEVSRTTSDEICRFQNTLERTNSVALNV